MPLPQPRAETILVLRTVLRTDFSDDAAWEALKAAISAEDGHGEATFGSDQAYDGASVQSLIAADTAADDDAKVRDVFVADSVAMTGSNHALLAGVSADHAEFSAVSHVRHVTT
jgi:hypothetical protein